MATASSTTGAEESSSKPTPTGSSQANSAGRASAGRRSRISAVD